MADWRRDVLIRPESNEDRDAVRAVNTAAFGQPGEADLVDALRDAAEPCISLVADDDGEIVGHIMFSPVSVAGFPDARLMGLAPMAVVPVRQREGIGTDMATAGLERCRQADVAAVVVLGHAEYYPRFGFLPASRCGLESEYDVPDDVFMALELQPDALRDITGTVRFHPAFAGV